MLSIEHPSLLSSLRHFGYGLMPVFHGPVGTGALVLKLPKEAILAARLNNEVKVYLLSDGQGPASHLGVVTAFFEDDDEPLMIATTLFSDDDLLPDLVSVLSQQSSISTFSTNTIGNGSACGPSTRTWIDADVSLRPRPSRRSTWLPMTTWPTA